MLKKMRKANGGFTLVELVVVLVILAIMAAMLIPALTGYIDKANENVVISEARSVYIAAQSEIGEAYAKDAIPASNTISITSGADTGIAKDIKDLSEVKFATGMSATITVADDGSIATLDYIGSKYEAHYVQATGWTYAKKTAATE